MNPKHSTMKTVIQRSCICMVALLGLLPCNGYSETVKFGVIADIHQGYLTDVKERLQVFLDEVEREEGVDFIIQLGDFTLNQTKAKSGDFLDLWNSFTGPKYHVLGNHDMDLANKAQVRAYWGMPANYYSFDLKGFRFVVLDGNHIKQESGEYLDYKNSNYYSHKEGRGYFGPRQVEWFKEQLASTDLHVVGFSHQRVSDQADGPAVRKVIDNANAKAGSGKFVLSLNGHGHRDLSEVVNQVPYVEIPTAAHKWEGKAVPYTTVRFAIVTLDTQGTVDIDARSVAFEYQGKGKGASAVGGMTDKFFRFAPNRCVETVTFPEDVQAGFKDLNKQALLYHPVGNLEGKIPLIVSLHGAGGTNKKDVSAFNGNRDIKWLLKPENCKYVAKILVPQSAGLWDPGSLDKMLDYVLKTNGDIDKNRVYCIGYSMGGKGSWEWAMSSPKRFAAIVPVAFIPDLSNLKGMVDLPIWAMVGTNDRRRAQAVPRMEKVLKELGSTVVRTTIFEGANHAATASLAWAEAGLLDWLFAQTSAARHKTNSEN